MIEAHNIYRQFGDVEVLKGVDLKVSKGEIVAIVGASGSGKTTLLNILGTLDKPTNGSLKLDSKDVFSFNDKNLANFRNQHLGFVFQFHQLLAEFTALENITLPALIAKQGKKEAEERANMLLEHFNLKHRKSHKPAELSGGEKQRVAVARALMNQPKIILADEPTGNLDSNNRNELHEMFVKLRDQFNQTVVIVSHDEQVKNIADRTLTMCDGIIK